jgi:hypothetical protein
VRPALLVRRSLLFLPCEESDMAEAIFEVDVVVKQVRTYLVKAESRSDAEDEALSMAENEDQPIASEFFDGNPYIHDSREVSE